MKSLLRLIFIGSVCAVICISCSKKNSTGIIDPGTGIPSGIARISGTVKDAAGADVQNAMVHIVYEFAALEPRQPAHPMNMATACLSYWNDTGSPRAPLMTECGGNVPIPDGPMISLYWDRNSNGADSTDPLLPLCEFPPDCDGSTPGTVNFNQMPFNGTAQGAGAGYFIGENCLSTYGQNLTPNLIYARVFCADGRPLYTSDVITIVDGYGEYNLNFHCTPCNGAPIIPDWHLTQGYPNPVVAADGDTVLVDIGLQSSSRPLLTLDWPYSARMDTLLSGDQPAGARRMKVVFDSNKPNGLYEVKLQVTGSYTGSHTILKNIADEATLRGQKEATATDASGHFTFDAATGVGISRRSISGSDLGLGTLSRVRVIAVKPGYNRADSTFNVSGSTGYELNLIMTRQ